MTVRELIKILNTHNPDHTVVVETIANNMDIDHTEPGITFSRSVSELVIIYPKAQ